MRDDTEPTTWQRLGSVAAEIVGELIAKSAAIEVDRRQFGRGADTDAVIEISAPAVLWRAPRPLSRASNDA